MSWSLRKKRAFSAPFILSEANFFVLCLNTQCIEHPFSIYILLHLKKHQQPFTSVLQNFSIFTTKRLQSRYFFTKLQALPSNKPKSLHREFFGSILEKLSIQVISSRIYQTLVVLNKEDLCNMRSLKYFFLTKLAQKFL